MNWIPVAERLPKDGQDVLIGWDGPRDQSYKIRVQAAEYRHWTYDKELGGDLKIFRTWGGGYPIKKGDPSCPSHWMPFPDPPTKE